MDIQVNRVKKEDSLVFEIVVTDPHTVPFSEEDAAIMNLLEDTKNKFSQLADDDCEARIRAEQGILYAKNKVFDKVLESLKFAIKNQLQVKFDPICQEIFNWIQDHQEGRLQRWMSECYPQRTKFYFDNDQNIEKSFDDEPDEDEDE